MPLRIAIDVRHARDFGIGTYIRNLVQALARLDSTNRYLLVGRTTDHHALGPLPPNYEKRIYNRSDTERVDHVTFPLFLRSLTADLFHIPLTTVPLLMPSPYVVTIHDLSNLMFQTLTPTRQSLRLFRMKRGLMRAARVIAVSQATLDDCQRLLGIPTAKMLRIYDAIDPRFLEHGLAADARAAGPDAVLRDRRRILERYQVHYPFLLYTGTIRPQKNIPRLVEAFAVLRQELEGHPQYGNLRLIIIGDEISAHPSVRRAVIQSGVQQVVRFLGFVPLDTLRTFYESAAAFVFPSLYEGFGLPPLEAMAAGTPVVTSDLSSLPEVVGDAAEIVNPENVFDIARGIREVLLNEEWRQTLIARGQAQALRFSWDQTARATLATYQEVARECLPGS